MLASAILEKIQRNIAAIATNTKGKRKMKLKKSDYEEYLDKYCKSRGFCREEAERHLIVQEYKKMCEEREKNDEKLQA